MKTLLATGKTIKEDNGSGYRLADAFPGRKFHDKTVYAIRYNGVTLDKSTVVDIKRSREGYRTGQPTKE